MFLPQTNNNNNKRSLFSFPFFLYRYCFLEVHRKKAKKCVHSNNKKIVKKYSLIGLFHFFFDSLPLTTIGRCCFFLISNVVSIPPKTSHIFTVVNFPCVIFLFSPLSQSEAFAFFKTQQKLKRNGSDWFFCALSFFSFLLRSRKSSEKLRTERKRKKEVCYEKTKVERIAFPVTLHFMDEFYCIIITRLRS